MGSEQQNFLFRFPTGDRFPRHRDRPRDARMTGVSILGIIPKDRLIITS